LFEFVWFECFKNWKNLFYLTLHSFFFLAQFQPQPNFPNPSAAAQPAFRPSAARLPLPPCGR
jgi:hypothetical protein